MYPLAICPYICIYIYIHIYVGIYVCGGVVHILKVSERERGFMERVERFDRDEYEICCAHFHSVCRSGAPLAQNLPDYGYLWESFIALYTERSILVRPGRAT